MRANRNRNCWVFAGAVLATLAGSSLVLAAPGDEQGPARSDPMRRPPPMRDMKPPVSLDGVVTGYNHAGRGEIDGFFMTIDGKTAQINLPPAIGGMVSTLAPMNKSLKILASKMEAAADHDVYEFRGIDTGTGTPAAMQAIENKGGHAEGTIKSLNYARRGEVDGVMLDTGDFVHIGPREAEGLKLKVGDKFTADGPGNPMADGKQAIDADKVNGTALNRPPRPMGGPGGPDGPNGHPGGADEHTRGGPDAHTRGGQDGGMRDSRDGDRPGARDGGMRDARDGGMPPGPPQ